MSPQATAEAGAYIRDHYRVPARIGQRITYTWRGRWDGTIVGFSDARLLVQFDGIDKPDILHPTWEVEYHGSEDETD